LAGVFFAGVFLAARSPPKLKGVIAWSIRQSMTFELAADHGAVA
jgi:hypothetical protein